MVLIISIIEKYIAKTSSFLTSCIFILCFIGRNFISGIDGVFGPGTEVAVKNFQHSKKIKQDGITRAGTWSKLFT
ncbi:peptidoglycan-binding domain-containing protein [Peribacillus sp. B-H-3]|uniref:peptidoglycan-binding domain-containing protein n=1 Tax=Peribacillus sp. B-H-3 TaxID=3400420 RepID=UPI003B01ECD7